MPYTNNKGCRIYYEVEGSGSPIVLQHSFTSSLERWRECGYVDALKNDNCLILIDARGHGRSDKPHSPDDYAWHLRVGDVLAVIDELGLSQVNFWGYSMGGVYGFNLASLAPERLTSLIVGGAHPYATSFEAFRGVDGSNEDEFLAAFENLVGERFTPSLREKMLTNDLQALAASAGDRESLEDVSPLIDVPCLIYAGENDSRHSLAEKCASQMSRATFVSVPDRNHAQTNASCDLVLPHVVNFLRANTSHAH